MAFSTLLAHSFALDTGASASSVSMISNVVSLAVLVLVYVCLWVIYSKAGKPGWASIIPFYGAFVYLQIVGRPWWWFLLLFVPVVGFVILIMLTNDLSKSFGHGIGFTLGLIFLSLIFYPILAFGGSRYVGPRGGATAPMAYAA